MDEAPPNEQISSHLNSSIAASRQSYARRLAKMTLWSPFLGLTILIVFFVAAGNRSDDPRFTAAIIVVALCMFIWLAGLILGIVALLRRGVEDGRGVFGHALTGILFNLFFLAITVFCVASMFATLSEISTARKKTSENEAKKLAARTGDAHALQNALIASANAGFAARFSEVQKKYQNSADNLTTVAALDVTNVKNKQEMNARIEVIEDFIGAAKDWLEFSENSTEYYRQELLNHKLTPQAREESLQEFVSSLNGLNPAIVTLRKNDVHRGEAMLKLVEFLNTHWGKWEYDQKTDKLQFQDTSLLKDYTSLTEELAKISAETTRLREEIIEKKKPFRQ